MDPGFLFENLANIKGLLMSSDEVDAKLGSILMNYSQFLVLERELEESKLIRKKELEYIIEKYQKSTKEEFERFLEGKEKFLNIMIFQIFRDIYRDSIYMDRETSVLEFTTIKTQNSMSAIDKEFLKVFITSCLIRKFFQRQFNIYGTDEKRFLAIVLFSLNIYDKKHCKNYFEQ